MAAGFNAEFAWNCCFTAHTALIGIEGPVHFHGLGHFSVDWIAFLFFFFFFQICTLQVGMVVSWGSQETRGLLIRVATIGHKYCHGEGNTNTPGKLSGKKAQVVSMVWEGL